MLACLSAHGRDGSRAWDRDTSGAERERGAEQVRSDRRSQRTNATMSSWNPCGDQRLRRSVANTLCVRSHALRPLITLCVDQPIYRDLGTRGESRFRACGEGIQCLGCERRGLSVVRKPRRRRGKSPCPSLAHSGPHPAPDSTASHHRPLSGLGGCMVSPVDPGSRRSRFRFSDSVRTRAGVLSLPRSPQRCRCRATATCVYASICSILLAAHSPAALNACLSRFILGGHTSCLPVDDAPLSARIAAHA